MNERTLAARKASHASWANTVDRERRTRAARNNSPTGLQWHLDRLPVAFDGATAEQRNAAAESSRKAYMVDLAMRSARVRGRAS